MVRSSVPATLKPHLEEESSIISVTTRMVGRFFYWNGRKMHSHDDDASPVQCHKCNDQEGRNCLLGRCIIMMMITQMLHMVAKTRKRMVEF